MGSVLKLPAFTPNCPAGPPGSSWAGVMAVHPEPAVVVRLKKNSAIWSAGVAGHEMSTSPTFPRVVGVERVWYRFCIVRFVPTVTEAVES